jgi:release factor glutamine methyltransferase
MELNYDISGVISHLKGIKKKTKRIVLGKELILLPKVFDPKFIDSGILASCIKGLDGNFENVLDLGTGCGIQTIFIGNKANKIVASDINPYALENARLNILAYNLINKTQIIKSNLFSNIKEKFLNSRKIGH